MKQNSLEDQADARRTEQEAWSALRLVLAEKFGKASCPKHQWDPQCTLLSCRMLGLIQDWGNKKAMADIKSSIESEASRNLLEALKRVLPLVPHDADEAQQGRRAVRDAESGV